RSALHIHDAGSRVVSRPFASARGFTGSSRFRRGRRRSRDRDARPIRKHNVRQNDTTMAGTRTRRTEGQRIKDLEAQITARKQRAERKKMTRDPALRHVSAALRSIDKALANSEDSATRQALDEARATLSAALSLNGVAPKASLIPRGRRGGGSAVEAETI